MAIARNGLHCSHRPSVIATADEAGSLAQRVGTRAERLQRRDGGCFHGSQAPAGGRDPEHADDGRLAGRCVLGGRLAEGRRIAVDVEQVVGDLEGPAERLAIAVERRGAVGRAPPRMAPARRRSGSARRSSSLAAARHGRHRRRAGCAALVGLEVEALAAGHAGPAGGARQLLHQPARTAASGCASGRPGSRRPASAAHRRPGSRSTRRRPCARSACRAADRRRPWPADRRAPASSSARIRAPRRPSSARGGGHAEQRRRVSTHQERPKPLAAAERAVPHGLRQSLRRAVARELCAQTRLDTASRIRELLGERHGGLPDLGQRHRRWPVPRHSADPSGSQTHVCPHANRHVATKP